MANKNPVMVVPFATGNNIVSTTYYPPNSTSGNSSYLAMLWGWLDSVAATGIGYDIDLGLTQYLSFNSINDAVSFAVATDITRVSIHAEIFVTSTLTNSNNPTFWAAIGIADSNSNTFRLLPQTKVPIVTGTNFTARTPYANSLEDVEVAIPRGSRVVIVCGHDSNATTYSTISGVYFSGGVAFW